MSTSTTSTTAPAATGTGRARTGFWLLAAGFVLVMSFMTVPTPLYGLYSQRDGFGTFTITLIFAAYGLGVIVGLLFAGHVSDHLGRRPVVLTVVVVEVLCAVLFALFSQESALLALRFVTGLGVGALSAAMTAWLTELHDHWRPGSDGVLGRTVATATNVLGLGLGPLLAALLATTGRPLVVPYVVYAVAMVPVALIAWYAPETVPSEQRVQPWRYRPQRVAVDPEIRSPMLGASVAALAGFSVLGFVTSLSGRFLADTLGITSRLTIGTVATVIVVCSAVSQVLLARLTQRRRLQVGAGLVAVGMVVLATGALATSLVGFVLGGMLAVGGVGLIFAAAVTIVAGLAAPERRGETLAALFLAGYVGITVPVVLIGVALSFVGTVPVLVTFAALVLVAVPSGIAVLLRQVD
ncbi:MAG: transporter [Friedmanniella sp.]|nr:transporter [Friedmanniella sp.]